jgi:PIN domain nuclease of toxin-antitoxin system
VRFLLDTHALLWWMTDDSALPVSVRELLSKNANEILVSAASGWEIATKLRLGKLPIPIELIRDLAEHLAVAHFEKFSITMEHSVRAGLLPGPHKDPFDRMLISQAQEENIPIVSNDKIFDSYGVQRIW